MASIFTLEGNDEKRRRKRARGRKRSSSLGAPPSIGDCKCVKAGRGRRFRKICFVGKSRKAPTGWLFQKGPSGACR